MVIRGNVGEVRTGQHQNVQFLSWSVAENHGYFDKNTNQWVDKGTVWHNCTMSFIDNAKRFEHFCNLITKGAPVLVSGRLSINPQEKQNEKGETVRYDNQYIQVETVGLTLDRIESVSYRQKQDNSGANDPELQQRGQKQAPVQQTQQQAPQQTTPFDTSDDPFMDEDVKF